MPSSVRMSSLAVEEVSSRHLAESRQREREVTRREQGSIRNYQSKERTVNEVSQSADSECELQLTS